MAMGGIAEHFLKAAERTKGTSRQWLNVCSSSLGGRSSMNSLCRTSEDIKSMVMGDFSLYELSLLIVAAVVVDVPQW